MIPPPSFQGTIFPEELNAIEVARSIRDTGSQREMDDQRSAIERAREMRLFGLALSGGGIRSATFNLGVLQALHHIGLLKKVDYLSTVSGGGYIGSWLTGWTKRIWMREHRLPDLMGGAQPTKAAQSTGGPSKEPDAARHEPRQVFFLRRFSNYLAPRLGMLSADTLALVMTYLRNLLLNMLIVTSALAGVLVLIRWVANLGRVWLINPIPPSLPFVGLLAALGLLQAGLIFGQLVEADEPRPTRGWRGLMRRLAPMLIVVVLIVLSALLTRLATMQLAPHAWYTWGGAGAVLYSLACFIGWWIHRGRGRWGGHKTGMGAWDRESIGNVIVLVLTAPFCGFLLGCLFHAFTSGTVWALDFRGLISLSPAVILAAIAVVGFLHIGLAGRGLSDQMREWWSRMGAWHVLAILSWTGVFCVALLPDLDILPTVGEYLTSARLLSGLVWLASTLAGVWAARSPRTGPGGGAPWLDMVAKVAPYVFILGLLILLSYAAQYFGDLSGAIFTPASGPLFAGACFLAFSLLLSWRVDVNEFSMLSMYRNRLARCYLGASNLDRDPNSTGLDPDDDNILLSDLSSFPPGSRLKGKTAGSYAGPYPLVNTAINLVQTSELAWQERKAASFVLTPHYCGFTGADLSDAYRPTPDWLKLGTAMAISGAAVSPNMGYHTSKATAFLLTVFNARLGRWFPNPGKKEVLTPPGPTFGLFYLLYELLGLTNHERSFVYLSDGGHFENIGVYELLRRRCRYIIACDASADPAYRCEDISKAVAKARTDLGVEIDLDLRPVIAPEGSAKKSAHCVTGRIRYPAAGGGKDEGTILYLKASLTGDESPDIDSYASGHEGFPHQTTADQFFEESQFESYRALGYHVATECLRRGGAIVEEQKGSLEDLFTLLRQQWYPPLSVNGGAPSQYSRVLSDIATEIRTSQHLKFLDYQLFPEWPALTGKKPVDPRTFWLPADEECLREGFYVCSRVIQLMEDVYRDLDLENQFEHPDNSGWMNLFKHWTWSSMFRVTWAVTHSVHGVRFRTFCEDILELPVGEYTYERRPVPISRAVKGKSLNFHEVRIVERLLEDGLVRKDDIVIPFHLVTTDPQNDRHSITFTYGFGIVRSVPDGRALVYLRIQDHLRRLGLARRAVVGLFKEGRVNRILKVRELSRAEAVRKKTGEDERPKVAEAEITGASLDILARLVESVPHQQRS